MIESLSSFEEQVLNSSKYVVLDFWAEWCAPCKAMIPVLNTISQEFKENLCIYKVDIDNQKYQNITIANHIKAVPTLVLFNNGKQLDRKTGAQTKQQLISWLESFNCYS